MTQEYDIILCQAIKSRANLIMNIQEIRNSIKYQLLHSDVSKRAAALLSLLEKLDPDKARVDLQVNGPNNARVVVYTLRSYENSPESAEFWKEVRALAEEQNISYRISDDEPPTVAFDISLS